MRRSGWDGFPFFGARAFGFAWPRRGRRQWFDAGDMKYVILKLLRDRPRHGYEIMKDLEEQLQGCYSPSPGTVYPTLQWLEDEGLVVSRDAGGKKVYDITEQGRAFLDEHRDAVDEIFERLRETVERTVGGAMADVNRALGTLVKNVYRTGWKSTDEAMRKKLAEILERAAAEVDGLGTASARNH